MHLVDMRWEDKRREVYLVRFRIAEGDKAAVARSLVVAG